MKQDEIDRMMRHAEKIAEPRDRSSKVPDAIDLMWALTCEAAKTGRQQPAPPRTGYPGKSAGFQPGDDISYWQKMLAYLAGEVEKAPETETRPARATPEQVTRCEVIEELFRNYTFTGIRQKVMKRKMTWMYAMGTSSRKIQKISGLSKFQVAAMKKDAMNDMLRALNLST